jgi:penicillin amidase/acyl-homoserine-lactone acylase
MARPKTPRLTTVLATAATLLVVLVVLTPGPRPLQPRAVDMSPTQTHDVRILRDTWGVPHVLGRTDADVAYGLAYAHAEDDADTIQGVLLAARGRLATVLGTEGAPNDYMVALLRVRETVDARYATDLGPDVRALVEAYAAGLNRYLALHPEEAWPGVYPVEGRDVVAGFVHKLPLFFGLDRTLGEIFGPDRARPVSRKDETRVARAPPRPLGSPIGSNAIAVAPRRTADGFTRLVVNSHQPWEGPVAWYEAHLKSEEGWDMVGGLFPGAPVVLHGHNRDLGWAHTVNRPDLVDVFVLETHPDDPYRYRLDGEWRTLERREAPIEVRLWGHLHWTMRREVLWSVHGPVVRRPHGTYAIRFAGLGEVRQVEQWYRMNRARDREEWRAAMRLGALPMFNCVYADWEGHVEYLYNAELPRRAEGYDWSQYLPGDTSETLWGSPLPFEELPRVEDPASGFVMNANSSPFQATVGPGNPDPGAYSPTHGIETHLTNRARRALELLAADASLTRAELDRIKFDDAYSGESRTASVLRDLLSAAPPPDPLAREGLEVLRGWDLRADPDNTAAALALLTLRPSHDDDPGEAGTAERMRHLGEAARRMKAAFGRLDVPLREVQRLRRGDLDLGVGGAPDVLRAVYARPHDDGRLVGHAGDSYMMIVEWDPEGRVHSRSVHQYGSATLDQASPHYADQAPLFVREELKPIWMDEEQARSNLEREYSP